MSGWRSAPPRASSLLESLRGMGYSVGSAVADIVDNSLAAGARHVDVRFIWSDHGASRVLIVDDGRGMDDAALEQAMTLGERSPLDARASEDLGRFGMGLKTASFSQCRRLTVASRRDGSLSCLRWDLDDLASRAGNEWALLEGPSPESAELVRSSLQAASGTLVLWEKLDRIVTRAFTANHFLDVIDEVEAHLAMVFHRLLGSGRLQLSMNGRAIISWDPFMSGHPAKRWESPVERRSTEGGTVSVRCHVLPHKDRLSPEEFDKGAGPAGWSAQQGFYVYRGNRLLLAGGWLGLGRGRAWNREEAYRLARVELHFSNSADALWKIDIRKSTAEPPVTLRPWLTTMAEDTRERARRVFAFRAAPRAASGGTAIEPAWRSLAGAGGSVRYRIDDRHPAVAAVLETCGESAPLVRAMLRVIEETVPVQRIWLDTAEARDTPRVGFEGQPGEEVVGVLHILFRDMVERRGMSAELARRTLATTEPFQAFPQLVAALRTDG